MPTGCLSFARFSSSAGIWQRQGRAYQLRAGIQRGVARVRLVSEFGIPRLRLRLRPVSHVLPLRLFKQSIIHLFTPTGIARLSVDSVATFTNTDGVFYH